MADVYDYVLCGAHVRSCVALPGLPVVAASSGDPDIEVRRVAIDSAELSERPGIAPVDVRDGVVTLLARGTGTYRASGGRLIEMDLVEGVRREDVLLYLMGSMLGTIWHQRGMLPLHGSAVRVGDGCAVFCGPSGAGKSTLAGALARRGRDLVADDVSVVTAGEAGGLVVWPGPARLKLDLATLDALEVEGTSLAPAGGTRGKFHLPVSGEQQPLRLERVYVIAEGAGEARLERLTGLDAVDAVHAQIYCEDLARGLGLHAQVFRWTARIAREATISRLVRVKDRGALSRMADLLESEWQTVTATTAGGEHA